MSQVDTTQVPLNSGMFQSARFSRTCHCETSQLKVFTFSCLSDESNKQVPRYLLLPFHNGVLNNTIIYPSWTQLAKWAVYICSQGPSLKSSQSTQNFQMLKFTEIYQIYKKYQNLKRYFLIWEVVARKSADIPGSSSLLLYYLYLSCLTFVLQYGALTLN